MSSEFKIKTKELERRILQIDLSQNPENEEKLIQILECRKYAIIPFKKSLPRIERLTINRTLEDNNNTTINEIKHLKYPPKEKVNKPNRANFKGQSVLYATLHKPTALLENFPKVGDLVTTSVWELKDNVEDKEMLVYPVIDITDTKDIELLNVFTQYLSRFPKEYQECIIADSTLIASCFKRPVKKGQEINYTASAYFADKIFNDWYNQKIQAIVYPSVKDSTKTPNIAIKPHVFDEKYKLVEVHESVIENINNGTLSMRRIKKNDTI
ncbi:hypothetical protein BZG01_21130 [Labilibaculum manganireducens]|uniref:RES domain-containing protein n=1 Tax=Labilibaculum manganireducens TaxID=1940525 RepID=A0A2N3HQG8_9BACT|nr:RES family NAD+ phosphorylase [Labilibaculum manganireducens]PKQ60298.1 hypothetical protein BZG01_21130 [Labilibaculum manganireducens]